MCVDLIRRVITEKMHDSADRARVKPLELRVHAKGRAAAPLMRLAAPATPQHPPEITNWRGYGAVAIGRPPSFCGFLSWFGFPFVGPVRGVSHQRPWTTISKLEFGLSHFFPK